MHINAPMNTSQEIVDFIMQELDDLEELTDVVKQQIIEKVQERFSVSQEIAVIAMTAVLQHLRELGDVVREGLAEIAKGLNRLEEMFEEYAKEHKEGQG